MRPLAVLTISVVFSIVFHAHAQTDALEIFRLAYQKMALGKIDEAIELYKKGLEIKPDSKEAWYNLGVAYGKKGLIAKEVEAYKKALELDESYGNALFNLGLAFRDMGQKERALQVFERLLLLEQNTAEVWNNIGVLKLEMGNIQGAREAFSKAIQIGTQSADPYFNLAIVLVRLADEEKDPKTKEDLLRQALEACDQALARDQGHFRAAYNKGVIAHRIGLKERAVEAYKLALSIRPDYKPALYNLAVELNEQGKCDEALATFEAYLHIAVSDPKEAAFVQGAKTEVERLKEKCGQGTR